MSTPNTARTGRTRICGRLALVAASLVIVAGCMQANPTLAFADAKSAVHAAATDLFVVADAYADETQWDGQAPVALTSARLSYQKALMAMIRIVDLSATDEICKQNLISVGGDPDRTYAGRYDLADAFTACAAGVVTTPRSQATPAPTPQPTPTPRPTAVPPANVNLTFAGALALHVLAFDGDATCLYEGSSPSFVEVFSISLPGDSAGAIGAIGAWTVTAGTGSGVTLLADSRHGGTFSDLTGSAKVAAAGSTLSIKATLKNDKGKTVKVSGSIDCVAE